MKIKEWFVDGHPQRYHVAALLLAMAAVSLALTARSLAEEGSSTSSSGSTTTVQSCSYSYSSWGDCQSDGKRYRTVTGVSPSGCVQTSAPVVQDTCSYSPPTCTYSYSDWSACQSTGKQYRTVTGASPSGCSTTGTAPVVERSCTYTAPTTNTTTSTSTSSGSGSITTSTACSYSYSSWSACQSDGKRYRSVTGMSPTGCVQTTAPQLYESCTYTPSTATSDSSDSGSSSSSDSTTTSVSTTQCLYTYGAWGNCESNGKRIRALASKLPSGCAEYTKPVLEQACVYDVTVTSSSTASTTSTTSTTATSNATTTATETGAITPSFSFKNVIDGMLWKGVVKIEGQVQGAEKVEYYLVPVGSNIFKYLGSARLEGEDVWRVDFRSTEFPNGEFYLRAKIKNRYGEYGSGQRTVRIANVEGTSIAVFDGTADAQVVEAMNQEKKERLTQVVQELKLPLSIENTGSLDEQKKQIFSYCEASPQACAPTQDTDQDGLSDIDEIRFDTDPKGADSDLDGFIDGDEVRNGFDPAKYSPGDQSDRMVFESPKQAGEVKQNYVVQNVELKPDDAGKGKLRLTGKGLPNSFVTLYIYSSDPIVLTVKTDSEGNWVYELDKELDEGEHEAYVAITDNTGKITGKSEPLAFVKTAQAVTVIPNAEAAPLPDTHSVSENRSERDLIFLISLIIGGVAIALATIGLIKHRHNLNKDKLVILPPQS